MNEPVAIEPSTPRRSLWVLGAATALSLLAYVSLVVLDTRHGTLRADVIPTTIAWYGVAVAAFGAAVWSAEKRGISKVWLWVVPLGFRALLLTTTPTLSDDVYRYVWDGHVITEGQNPYTYPISAPELDKYEIPARRLANNTNLASPYLPTAHAVFAATSLVLPQTPRSLQFVMTAFDVGTAVLLSLLLRATGLPQRRLMLYWWNPLVIIEIAHGTHLDAAMVFFSLAAVLSALPTRDTDGRSRLLWLSPIALALATLTRPIPLLLAPVLWWRWGWRERGLFAATLVGSIIPFGFGPSGWGLAGDLTGTGVFGSARVYSRHFRFNGGLSRWIENLLVDTTGSSDLTTPIIAFAMTLVLGATWFSARRVPNSSREQPGQVRSSQVRSSRQTLRLASLPIMAYVLLTPVLHPWYLIILIAFGIFLAPAQGHGESPDRWILLMPWAYLTTTIFLTYLTYQDPTAFGERDWIRRLEWFPTIALLALSAFWVFFATHAEPARTDDGMNDQTRRVA